MRSITGSSGFISCAEISTAICCSVAIRASSATTSCALRRSRLASGSSSSSSRGWLISACAIRTRCCSPPESCPTRASAKRARVDGVEHLLRRAPGARATAAGCPKRCAVEPERDRSRRAQRHVRDRAGTSAGRSRSSGVRAARAAAADAHASRELARCRPRITRNSVVLPAPFEPIRPVNSPARPRS